MDLKSRMLAEIAGSGPMTFARFMGLALYDPAAGYYSGGAVKIGPAGDFITSPHVSAAFGKCLANLAVAADHALGNPECFHLIEGGPGEGELARVMLEELAARHPDLYRRLAWSADETSPALAARQAEKLIDHGRIIRPLPESGATGLYLANEVADALPVNVLLVNRSTVLELCVGQSSGRLLWLPADIREPYILRLADEILGNPVLSQERETGSEFRIEVCGPMGGWLKSAASRLARGYIVNIDYGDLEEKLYGAGKPEGTLRGFKNGNFSEDILADPGHCDITASVNFSAYLRLAGELGLETSGLLKQWELLEALNLPGVLSLMEENVKGETEKLSLRQELWPLLFPGVGMGEKFKAVISGKGIGLAPLGEWAVNGKS